MNLASAFIEFPAWHYDPEEDWHEHVWRITASWSMNRWCDRRDMHKWLWKEVNRLTIMDGDRRVFPLPLWSDESIARALQLQKDIVRLNIDREGGGVEMWLIDGHA
jgi:hypothetical protein